MDFRQLTMNQIVDTLARQSCTQKETDVQRSGPAPVLVAVELSKDSEAALHWASSYAESVGAPLEILHVVHDPADSPGTYRPDGGDPLEPMADVAKRRLEEILDRVGSEIPEVPGLATAKRICVEGLPVQKILDVARAHGARLLVLGGRRRSGLGRLVHGSTAVQIAREAGFPVTIVKANGG